MSLHRYKLEPLPKLQFAQKRTRVTHCPCGKSNKDGKFVPFINFTDRGYCHSCGLTFKAAVHDCPSCKKTNAFSRYTDTAQGNEYIDNSTGKCLYCSYHQTPNQLSQMQGWKKEVKKQKSTVIKAKKSDSPPPQPTTSFIDNKVLKQSRIKYQQNNFITWLETLFDKDTIIQLISRYHIGTSKYWPGATVFWQIDTEGKIRSGKIMLYDPTTGKRVKKPYNHITWVHKALKVEGYSLKQCFFGEHLLKQEPTKLVAIVESEKTAILASAYFPRFIWLAAGSKEGLTQEKCKALSGRKVILFPDLNSYEKWLNKSKEISWPIEFTISDLLENKANLEEKQQGLDLADYLQRFHYSTFSKQHGLETRIQVDSSAEHKPSASSEKGEKSEALKTNYFSCLEELPIIEKSKVIIRAVEPIWDISALVSYFQNVHLPIESVKMDSGTVITDPATFVEAHLSFVKNNNGNTSYLPYLHRLQKLKEHLSNSY